MEMETIFKEQEELGGEIEKLLINYKKDGPARRTPEYLEKRITKLDQLWGNFHTNHMSLNPHKEQLADHPYFTNQYYEVVKENCEKLREAMVKAQAILTTPIPVDEIDPILEEKAENTGNFTFMEKMEHHESPRPTARSTTHPISPNHGGNQPASQLMKLIKGQKAGMQQLTHMLERVNARANEQFSVEYCEIMKDTISVQFNKLCDNHQAIVEEMNDDSMPMGYSADVFLGLQDFVEETAILLAEQRGNLIANQLPNDSHMTRYSTHLQLPRVVLPKFNGSYLNWIEFKNLFIESVDKQQIGNAQKMWFLKTNLSGEPESLIKHMPISESNYLPAWQTIQDRYDNKRLIVTSLLEKLLQQPAQQVESATALKNLHDSVKECLLGLKGQHINVEHWDAILTHLLLKKIDRSTHNQFESSLTSPREIPSTEELLKFLELRFQALESLGKAKTTSSIQKGTTTPNRSNHYRTSTVTIKGNSEMACVMCKGKHPLHACSSFLHLSNHDKWSKVKLHKLCCNCLRPGHLAATCTARCCLRCPKKHNTILHVDPPEPSKSSNINNVSTAATTSTPTTAATNLSSKSDTTASYVFLGTAMIEVENHNGDLIECRALLDSGSQVNIITESLHRQLGFQGQDEELKIIGIGTKQTEVTKRVTLKIKSKINNYSTYIEAVTIPKITSQQPLHFIDKNNWNIPKNIKLADNAFNKPQPIDILIGAEIYSDLMCIGQIRPHANLPTLQNTQLGWIVLGRLNKEIAGTVFCGISTGDLSKQVHKFWALEEISNTADKFTSNEKACEDFFERTTTRGADGRFIVQLPFADNVARLGNSQYIAETRFKNLEKRLSKEPELKKEYAIFLKEYLDLGHMEEIKLAEIPSNHYFLPHHAVFKPDSSSTKLRVVFDASAKTTNNISLNNLLMTGPTIQDDIFSILLRFRFPKYVFSADIAKMYRQIWVQKQDTYHQLILWRENPSEDLKYYRLKTVTYGTTSAPYLATKCLQSLAREQQSRYPQAAKIVAEDFYVDDIMTGCNNLEKTKTLQKQLTTMLNEAGFPLRKWCANHPKLLEDIPLEHRELKCDLSEDSTVKTLGMIWNPLADQFSLQTTWPKTSTITKRTILAELSQVYDPLGLINPIIVSAKIIMSELWQLKLDWDEAIPQVMHTKWSTFREQIPALQCFKAQRRVIIDAATNIQIHGFADASQKAYGAAVYVRSRNHMGATEVQLLCAKSRVSPIKPISIARLELCAAKLLTDLIERVNKSLKIKVHETFYWSDSTIVLAWIATETSSKEVFLANRIAAIQRLSTPQQWRHIPTKQNPADLISRGVLPEELLNCTLWFKGPEFLREPAQNWPTRIQAEKTNNETSSNLTSTIKNKKFENILRRIDHRNSHGYLQRVVGFILRFGYNCKRQNTERKSTRFLDAEELHASILIIIKMSQKEQFEDELAQLSQRKQVAKTSKLKRLAPFIDDIGLLRVGGRLEASSLSPDEKHQIILCNRHPHTKLLMEKLHWNNLHAGPQALLAITRQRFWPLQGGKLAQKVCHECFRCFITKPQAIFQMMGNLPADRIEPARPFIHVGIDFAGPMQIHYKLRGKRPTKAYLAVFVCFTTKAIHLELVSDLTTAAFIGALKRFIGRRGHPAKIYCDNATNFIGAKAELNELNELFNTQEHKNKVVRTCAEEGIQWFPIPPRSPHFGGLWEAAVKSAKYHLRRVINSALVTFEELSTIIVQIEAVLNSRPITPLSNNPSDLEALTPGHFLIGSPLTALIEPNQHERNINILKRWEKVQAIHQEFWRRWSKEYLQGLQVRSKWLNSTEDIPIDTLVLIKEDNLPPLQWKLGRIVSTIKGEDGLIRVADVKTAKGTYRRAIQNLCPLPIKEDEKEDTEQQKIPPQSQASTKPVQKKKRIFAGHSYWTTPEAANGEIPKNKKSKISGSMLTKTLLLTMLILPISGKPIEKNVEIENFDSQSGIYFENLGPITLINEDWRIIIYYNLQGYWKELENLDQYSRKLTELCSHLPNATSYCQNVISLLGHQLIKLRQYNQIFAPNNARRTRRSPFDIVGTLTNKLFGILDQNYAEQIEQTIYNVKKNEGHLLELIKNQTSVIDSTINILKKGEEYSNKQFALIDKHLSEFRSNLINRVDQNNKIQEFNAFVIQINLIMNDYKHMQDTIIDLLVDTHHGKISPFLLTPEQLINELYKIREHLPSNTRIPYESTQLNALYQLMTVKGGTTANHIVMVITLPLVSTELYELYHVIPTPLVINKNLYMIDITIRYLIIDLHRNHFYSMTEMELFKCHQEQGYICHPTYPVFTRNSAAFQCEISLFQQRVDHLNLCKLQRASFQQSIWWYQLTHANQWLFFAKNPTDLTIVCQKTAIQKMVNGSGVLTMRDSCTINQDAIIIKSYATAESQNEISLRPTLNITGPLPMLSQLMTFPEFHITIRNQSTELENMKKTISNIKTEQYLTEHDIHHYSISYALLAAILGVVIFIIYWTRCRQQTDVNNHKFKFHSSFPTTPIEMKVLPPQRGEDV